VTFTFLGTLLIDPNFPNADTQLYVVQGADLELGHPVVLRGLYASTGAGEFQIEALVASPALGGPGIYRFQN
jgi:hypothetical protein